MQISERTAVDFVLGNLGRQSLEDYLGQARFAEFVRLVEAGKDIAAAQQYQVTTGAGLPECHFAVQVARRFLA